MTDQKSRDSEIREIEGEILRGNPDLGGLCRALVDWAARKGNC